MNDRQTMFDFPAPADDAAPIDILKWMIAVMDRDDRSLMFVASVLASCIQWNGLTKKQAESAERVYARVRDAFDRGILAIQGGRLDSDDPDAPTNVTHLHLRRGKSA